MTRKNILLNICSEGHKFFKSSSCPTCPVCEEKRKPVDGFLSNISAPARRALELEGIKSLKELAKYRVEEVAKLHGIGHSAIQKLKNSLVKDGLSFNKQKK
ncbi:MAG: hypothetical protein R6W68_13970 [Ignavibacteriaceae bacterium]